MPSYRDMLMAPQPSRRERLLRLAMEILSLSDEDEDSPDSGVAPRLDGSQPEIYVAPRITPSP